jgi:thymidylate synthase (FAD)
MTIKATDQSAIDDLRNQQSTTMRPTVPALETLLYQVIPVLDHGFIRVVDYMGDDGAVVQAARVSYGRGTRKTSEDAGLINYLMRHAHTTPFEMCELKLHVKLPIFVARQWIRHRTANVNEYSGRYSILDREFYVPQPDKLGVQSATNRQGTEDALSPEQASQVLDVLRREGEQAFQSYYWMLNEDSNGNKLDQGRSGLSRELARMNLPLSTYTQWYWKIDLHNLLHFLRLRADPHAQYEIRVYAEAILAVVKLWVPLVHNAFVEHELQGARLSKAALTVVRRMLDGESLDQTNSGLSRREWNELMALLKPADKM